MSPTSYRPADRLHLWLLTVPSDPVLIGELNLVRESRGVSLRYADTWLERGFALSEDLPLIDEEFLPRDKETAVGAVDDARPDRWGERVIRFLDKPPRLSLLEYEKSHALLVTDAQQYELAPAYDVLPSGQALGFQQMRVGELEADSTLENALSMAHLFELNAKQAAAQVRRVVRVVNSWREHFAGLGVTRRDVELLAEQINRPFLANQRRDHG